MSNLVLVVDGGGWPVEGELMGLWIWVCESRERRLLVGASKIMQAHNRQAQVNQSRSPYPPLGNAAAKPQAWPLRRLVNPFAHRAIGVVVSAWWWRQGREGGVGWVVGGWGGRG